ncbi:hypothetical protein GCM10010924_06960 [Rhizobium wenxiniae]|uniref:Uncharacterized small protein (DUF1192 family) n=1 Tax=Rhizobium wenxiniae TaxID=1737357 RepID=A0A7W9Y202_9HYPH|nr:DUF4062 domain-containing protein [Rhizobium wenxiniae]MBB6160544.1 uncharacterized small protein (DUF1192 family) [Rhizobium wenxiniae]GGF82246.1 hypothetical protein GCM10010924_06960 [Rhizobium wenxiniae]
MRKKLQVFVSSTFTDLQSERQAAVQAILKAGHIPAGMELFTASDKSQWEIIKRWIDESDVYMLILGGRYGSVDTATGVSYTEMEYDYAVEQKKPLFSVVINEAALEAKVKLVGSSVFEQSDPQALKKFREKVLSTMSAFFSDDRDIKLAIHESLGELGHKADLVGWVSAAEIVDASALHAEITRLRAELDAAKSAKTSAQKSGKTSGSYDDLEEKLEILRLTSIVVPEDVSGRPPATKDLASLMSSYSNSLVNGVVQGATNPGTRFLYNVVFPKLIIHELAANEKPTGSAVRRSYLTEKGMRLLALAEKQRLMVSDTAGGTEKREAEDD